jgi:HEAT repeat protein
MNAFPRLILLATLVVALAAPAIGAEPDAVTRLDELLKTVAAFEYGQNAAALNAVEGIVVAAVKDPQQRAAVENRLLAVLDRKATRDAKEFVCRQLFLIGTVRCVPKLESLLADPALSHMARYTLGRIEGPEATAALLRALSKTSGKLRVGIVNTLGNRRSQEAVPELVQLLGSPDAAEAAVAALGDIGGPAAAQALAAARATAAAPLRRRLDDARLACADAWLAQGQVGEAAAIYESLHAADQPRHVRIGALRGLVEARGAAASGLLVEAIKSADPAVRAGAIGFTRTMRDPAITKTLVGLLSTLTPDAQELLLRALGERGDVAAAAAVMAAAQSEQAGVRLAALEALGSVGDAAAAVWLARTATAVKGDDQRVARASLVRLKGDAIDPALLQTLGSAEPNLRVELIRALAGRKATAALSTLFPLARDNDAAVRREAIAACGTLAREAELATLVSLAVQPKDAGDRPAIEDALAAAFRRVSDANRCAAPLLAALAGASADARPSLIRLLVLAPTPESLQAVRAALPQEAAVREAAVRALADWPNPAPAEDLLTLARTAPVPTHKVLALRGYVRLAGLSEKPTAMYTRALDLAERTEDKKLVLAGLGTASSAEALQLVERFLTVEALRGEAASAVVQIAGRLRETDAARATTALRNVLAQIPDAGLKQRAQELINELEQHEGHILAWLVTGPYQDKGKESPALFEAVLPPEKPEAKDVKWQPLKGGVGDWHISLDGALGTHEHAAAYARTRVWAPAEREARLELGSDDAIKAWLNGKLVHANYVNRSAAPRQDVVKVKLQAGWNDLLLKVVNHSGGWGYCCRLRQPDGAALPGLKVEAK